MNNGDLHDHIAALEARVEELEDDRAIRELLARYGYNADCCRDEEWVKLHSEDGVVSISSNQWRGRDEIREFIARPDGHHRPGFFGRSLHLQGNNVVSHIDGNKAVVNSYSIVLVGKDGRKTELVSAANNEWLLKKVSGRWLIEARRNRSFDDADYLRNLDATPE